MPISQLIGNIGIYLLFEIFCYWTVKWEFLDIFLPSLSVFLFDNRRTIS